MQIINISRISTVYYYETNRRAWENTGPRNFHCFAYQVTGHYDHTFPCGILPLASDCVIFIHKSDPYSVRCLEQGSSICVTFDADDAPASWMAECRDNPKILSLFRKLLQYKNLHQASNCYMAMAVIYEIMALICQKSEQPYLSNNSSHNVCTACDLIHEHYREPEFSTTRLSERCGIGDKYFRTLFKRLYGTTPAQYLIDLRLRTAADLLSNGSMRVTEAAQTAGFSDMYYFSKLFKRRFSCTPSDMRKFGTGKGDSVIPTTSQCSCHGSRFLENGELMDTPAQKDADI